MSFQKKQKLAAKAIKIREQAYRRQAKLEKLEKQAFQKRLKAWRAKYTVDDIKRFTKQADFVGIGKICTGRGGKPDRKNCYFCSFRVSKILKGKQYKEYTDGSYFVRVKLHGSVLEFIGDLTRNQIIFLSEKNLHHDHLVYTYQIVDQSDGVVEQNERNLQAVTEALRMAAKPMNQKLKAADNGIRSFGESAVSNVATQILNRKQ